MKQFRLILAFLAMTISSCTQDEQFLPNSKSELSSINFTIDELNRIVPVDKKATYQKQVMIIEL